MKIRFPKKKLDEAMAIAKQRNRKEKRFGGMTYGNRQGSYEAHAIGMVAEAAIAHLFKVKCDQTINHRGGDKGVDLVIPNIGNVAVKATTYFKDPLLRAEVEHDNDQIDIYICVAVNKNDLSQIWFVGWADREEVIKAKKRRFMRNGPVNYVLSKQELRNPKELLSRRKNNGGS